MNKVDINVLKYETDFYTVDNSQYVGGTDFNAITFLNLGINTVLIESVPLQQGQSYDILGSMGEISSQRFFVNFGTGASSGNNCVVIRKRYINV